MPAYAIIKLDTMDSRITKEKYNLENFSIFSRGTIKNVIRVMVREVAERTNRDTKIMEIREKLNEKDEIKVVTQRRAQTRVVVIVDGKYNSAIAQQLLQVVFENDDYERLIKDYKNRRTLRLPRRKTRAAEMRGGWNRAARGRAHEWPSNVSECCGSPSPSSLLYNKFIASLSP